MLRILHISTRLILGGSQENTILSCEGQARLGHEVHLAFGPIYGPEGSLLSRVEQFNAGAGLQGKGITTHVVPHLCREVSPIADWLCYWELRRLIRRLRPDVVHTHSSKAGILGRLAAWAEKDHAVQEGVVEVAGRSRGKPRVIHTIHGPPFMPVDEDAGILAKIKTQLNNAIYTAAERYAARRCDKIVSVADAMTCEFLRRGIGRPELYATIYSGMEIEAFVRAEAGQTREEIRTDLEIGETDFVVGTVARLAQHKGHDDVLDALGEDLRSDPHLKLLWVGDGWWRERLLERAREVGAQPGQIITTGLVSPERVPGLIRAMDVLVHPSYREGLPRTVPQAQLCSVLPIAYDCDGTSEAIEHMKTGLLVPTGDRAKLREMIRWARENPEKSSVMKSAAREAAARRFSTKRMIEVLENCYNAAG